MRAIGATSTRQLSLIAGLLYLFIIAGGVANEMFIRGGTIVAGDAVATAANIVAREQLWRVGAALELAMLQCAVILTAILYRLLRPVNRGLATLSLMFGVASVAVEGSNELQLLSALFPITGAASAAFSPAQLAALSGLTLRTYAHGFGAALVFFASYCLVTGQLIRRSGFMPPVLGVLMQVAAVSYLVNSFALIVAPALASRLFPLVLVPAFVGELALCLWLLLRGVRDAEWHAQPRDVVPAMHAAPALR